MTMINWSLLAEFKIDQQVVTKPWILVLDAPRQSTYLQIKAEGRWTPAGGLLGECGPDGLFDAVTQTERLVVPDCPVGALIGRFGGSSASLTPPTVPNTSPPSTPTEGKSFTVGSHCITAVPDKFIGPLYISFNGLTRPVDVAQLRITVSGATPTI